MEAEREAVFNAHYGAGYLSPRVLGGTQSAPYRALALGTCFLEDVLGSGGMGDGRYDFVLVNNQARGMFAAPADIADYDFQVIQIPVRAALAEVAAARLPAGDLEAHKRLFAQACERLGELLDARMKYNIEAGLPTLVMNFLVPQFNPMGRLLPRYDLGNLEYFFERLNRHLERLVRRYRGAYILDVDRIAASLGRRYLQDDSVLFWGHNALLHPDMTERDRLDATGSIAQHYDVGPGACFAAALIAEAEAMWRTISAQSAVKLVVIDLDDTLWRGVAADAPCVDAQMFAGWPYGFAEALLYLKKRGVLLAIISKNDEALVRELWRKIVGRALVLEDFAALRINWRAKADNMAEVLAGLNLLPRSVVFIDDNPAERAAMLAAFPDMRILGSHPYYLRRTLLLAPELQSAVVTAESARRTEMIQAQALREQARAGVTREDFLVAQEIVVTLGRIDGTDAPRFARAFELINKTNQFNTTGQRWTRRDCAAHFAAGGVFIVFDVADRFAEYGLVGVVILRGAHIVQWVMSCRVIGMEVERAVMAALVAALRARGHGAITATLTETDANLPCRQLYVGFLQAGESWVLDETELIPEIRHVRVEVGGAVPAPPNPPSFV